MKKFGTPNGAAPGNENENVGFAEVGTPPLPRDVVGFDDFFDGAGLVPPLLDGLVPFDPPEPFDPPGCEEGCCWCGWPPVCGGEALPVPVDFVPLPVPVPVPLPVGVERVGVGGGVGGVVTVGAHDSETPTTPTFTGSEIWESGVPGGTFTVNVRWPPPTKVTVITH